MKYFKIFTGIGLALLFMNCTPTNDLNENKDHLQQPSQLAKSSNFNFNLVSNQKELAFTLLQDETFKALEPELSTKIIAKSSFDKDGIVNFDLGDLIDEYALEEAYYLGQNILEKIKPDLDFEELRIKGRVCGPVDACVPSSGGYCGNCPGAPLDHDFLIIDLIRTQWKYIVENLVDDFQFSYGLHTQLPQLMTADWYFQHFSEAELKLNKNDMAVLTQGIEKGEIKVLGNSILQKNKEVAVAQLIFPKGLKFTELPEGAASLIINNFNFAWGSWKFCDCKFIYIPWGSSYTCRTSSPKDCFIQRPVLWEYINPKELNNILDSAVHFEDLDTHLLQMMSFTSINEVITTPEILQF